jgi:formylglycine-generating enzyme required for sulfatase activity
MKTLRHPNLLALHGTWQHGNWLIMAMELADGTLFDRLRQAVNEQKRPGIPLPELLRQMRAAAEGLDYLNGKGVQHRDVKPHNLLLVGGGVKVGDFGLAKLLQETVATASGSLTPAYASPEACNNEMSRWSDQYSLAITYCQLRGNRLPFEGPLAAVVTGHLLGEVHLDMIPEPERPAVARALAKKPQERWPNCTAFVTALAASVKRAQSPDNTTRVAPPVKTPRRRSLWPLVAAGVGLLGAALLVLLAVLLAQRVGNAPTAKTDDGKAKADPAVKPGPLAKQIENMLGMKLVLIPAGTFIMGSPKNDPEQNDNEVAHEVEITRPFYLGKYEVTKGEFAAFVRASNYKTDAEQDPAGGWGLDAGGTWIQKPEYTWRKTSWEQTDRHPVVNVSWNDAVAFCEWLSVKEGKKYRLPTEAEWEYCCRAGTTTRYCTGDNPETVALAGNVVDAAARGKFPKWKWALNADDGYVFSAPVGTFIANAFGLHDMHGNVWEWCQDWYDKDYYKNSPKRDPQGPAAGDYRVLRGGSFSDWVGNCRAAHRAYYSPAYRYGYFGFRVVCVP